MFTKELYDRFSPIPDEKLVRLFLEAAVSHHKDLSAAISSLKYELDEDGFVVCKMEVGFRYRRPKKDEYPSDCKHCPLLVGAPVHYRYVCMKSGEIIENTNSRGRYCHLCALDDEDG